ncbi:membrane hypothetical protein [Nostocoides japonicum T1-X7]|uniref:Uncharacterized protein n=1 Tax=Nostocoides japonicum T1-X7 TaxID=1194083 RepID=A0A077LZ58_9MICO|nr:hypothetical protein [Tetrasphaera japonica]CCH79178.1 membrane hypothetical protein [Tetrasphaera japonica T1-X7]
MNEVPHTEHTEANDHPPAPGQPPTGRPPDPGHGNQASTTVVHQSESKVGATNGVEASPGRLETFLDDKTTKKWSRIIAIGFVLGACVLAAWDGWDEALRVAQNAGRMTLAGGLATVAVVLFVVSRTGSTLRGSTTPILAVTAYAVAAWFLLALPDEGHPTGWNVDTRVIAFACLSVGFLLASAAMLKHESLERAFSVDTSVGSTVLMLWTAIVVYAIALFAGIALTEGSDFALDCQAAESRRCIDPAAWPDYLILLGVPGAELPSRRQTRATTLRCRPLPGRPMRSPRCSTSSSM